MLLRGEGGDTDHGEAVRQYEVAAAAGSAKALNGLGYEYFYGNHLQKNSTKAYGYFAEAARLDADGDSNFNAAHCLAHGIGVEKNVKEAARLYERAATRHGHFDAAYEIALVKHGGSGRTGRDVNRAREFFEACARAGWAARDVRAGFDAYLRGDAGRALLWYAEAAETGTDVAAANAAWLLDRDTEVRALVGSKTMPLAIRFHRLASSLEGGGDGYAALGDAVLNGVLVVPPGVDEGRAVSDDTISRLLETRHARALSYYSRAAQKGSARGAFAAARVRSKGAPGVPRDRKLAHKLFDDALQADPERMRWPVFLARAQLRLEEVWDGFSSSSPRRSRGNMRLSIGVAVLVVVVSVVRAVASSSGAAPVVVPEAAVPPSTTPVAVEPES